VAKIKYTKNELKAQRDSLKRFQRYLPTLLLKKQQLQMELRQLELRMEEKKAEEAALFEELMPWIKLFATPVDLAQYLHLETIKTVTGNIAGVNIPVLKEVVLRELTPDLHATESWHDDAIKTIARVLRIRIERQILDEQHRLIAEELRTTSQRVNLFEKVKIPEAKNNIRVIRIFLGDVQTSEVARGKIAKKKAPEVIAA
jgi:V/A-type H+-transporting ATPase subunit D